VSQAVELVREAEKAFGGDRPRVASAYEQQLEFAVPLLCVAESAEFLRRTVRGLTARLGIEDMATLALDRFRLRDEIERRINEHRTTERHAAFQALLLPESVL